MLGRRRDRRFCPRALTRELQCRHAAQQPVPHHSVLRGVPLRPGEHHDVHQQQCQEQGLHAGSYGFAGACLTRAPLSPPRPRSTRSGTTSAALVMARLSCSASPPVRYTRGVRPRRGARGPRLRGPSGRQRVNRATRHRLRCVACKDGFLRDHARGLSRVFARFACDVTGSIQQRIHHHPAAGNNEPPQVQPGWIERVDRQCGPGIDHAGPTGSEMTRSNQRQPAVDAQRGGLRICVGDITRMRL